MTAHGLDQDDGAAAAAALFAERGYEAVAVLDVAQAAGVSEQTVYNYFPVKEDLVFDRSAEIQATLVSAVAARPPGSTAAEALRPVIHTLLDQIATTPAGHGVGGMPALAAASGALRRAALERSRADAAALAGVLAAQGASGAAAPLLGWALAGVFELLIEDLGQAQRNGEHPASIARRLRPVVDERLALLGRLEDPAAEPDS